MLLVVFDEIEISKNDRITDEKNKFKIKNFSQSLDNRCTLLVMHYFRKEDLYDKKFNKNKNRRKRRSASWNQYSRNYEFPNHDSGQKCQR